MTRHTPTANVAARLLPCLLAIALVGCGSEPAPEYYPANLASTPLEQAADWQPCAWDPEKRDRLAECAFVMVPLDYGTPDGEQIRLLVKRRQATPTPSAQIWLVHGGPGASATAGMKDLSFGITEARRDIAFYAVDHRGVGGSERLGCPVQESADSPGGTAVEAAEWGDCLAAVQSAEGPRLARYGTTDSATDLARLIDKFRRPEVPVFVYGGSYGTYMVRRYLSLAPRQPDGVILEGIVPADGGMTGYDARMEATASRLLDACDAAEACARHFDAPLRTETSRMLAELEQGHCGVLNLTPETAKQLLAAMTLYADTRVLVPPLVHRIRRCNWSDVWFVARLALNFAAATRAGSYSPVLHYHVVLSEMYDPRAAADVLERQFDEAVLSTGMEASYARLYPRWPRYDGAPDSEPGYDGPLLLLQGGLDTASPLAAAQRVARRFDGPAQHLVLFPEGAHGVTGATPTTNGTDCARRIYLAFVDDPRATPDTGCIADIRPLDWRTLSPGTEILAGTTDLWGD